MNNKLSLFKRRKLKIIIFNFILFQSSMIIAEDNKPQNSIDSTRVMVNDYLEEGTANQLNKNLDAIDNYYDQLNSKMKKNSNNKPIVNEKQKIEVIIEQSDKLSDKTLDNKVIDTNLLELMKTAGVDKISEPADKKTKKESIVRMFRDPFSLTPSLTGGERQIEDSLPFAQKSFVGELPKMVLKGIVKKVDGTRIALIQLDDKLTYMVKENDRISLAAFGLRTVIHIQEIHESAIVVEPGEINSGQESEVIVVR